MGMSIRVPCTMIECWNRTANLEIWLLHYDKVSCRCCNRHIHNHWAPTAAKTNARNEYNVTHDSNKKLVKITIITKERKGKHCKIGFFMIIYEYAISQFKLNLTCFSVKYIYTHLYIYIYFVYVLIYSYINREVVCRAEERSRES